MAKRVTTAPASDDKDVLRQRWRPNLKTLVCSGDENAIFIARGNGFYNRLQAAALTTEGQALIDDLMNKTSTTCPLSALLTDADRAKLLQIKRDAAALKPAGK